MAAKITKLNDDTFMLTDRLIRVNQFLLRGKKSALLLDTGYGGENFLKAVKKLAALPVIAANTHLHPDHSDGNYLFEKVYVGEADLPQKGMPSNDLARGVAQYYREHTHIPKAIISKVESFGIIRPKGEEYLPLPKEYISDMVKQGRCKSFKFEYTSKKQEKDKLCHVFEVMYPMREDSVRVLNAASDFFKSIITDKEK